MDALRPRLPGDADRLRDGVPTADDEATASLEQRLPQIGQRVEQEGDPVRRTEAREDMVVEDEERHDVGRVVHRRMKGGVVMDAKVAREEDDGRAHRFHAAAAPRCSRRGSRSRRPRPARTA